MSVRHSCPEEIRCQFVILARKDELLLRKSARGRPQRARRTPRPLTAEARLGPMRWVLASYAASV